MQFITLSCPHCKVGYPWNSQTVLMGCCKDCFYKENEKICQQCNCTFLKSFLNSTTPYCKACMEFTCLQCHKKVERLKPHYEFCGEKCQTLFENPTCKNCKSTFHTSKKNSSLDYCSEQCRDDFTHRNCLCCNKRFKYHATHYFGLDQIRQLYCSEACRDLCIRKRCKNCKKVFEYDPRANDIPLYCSPRCDEKDHMSFFQKIADNMMTGMVVAAYGGQRC